MRDPSPSLMFLLGIGALKENERVPMLPPPALDHYFELADYLALRSTGLISLVIVLYRLIKMDWKEK